MTVVLSMLDLETMLRQIEVRRGRGLVGRVRPVMRDDVATTGRVERVVIGVEYDVPDQDEDASRWEAT